MSNHIETSAEASAAQAIAPNRALVAILLIPSLVCVAGLIVAFLVFALCGHLWALWIPIGLAVLCIVFELFTEGLARVLS